jgi:ABC-type Mn2+/Zn2+ transport system ATPase subunit
MTGQTLVILDRVAVGYGRNVVLSDVQLTINRGSFTGLLGANGSGKSTLIKTILGIISPVAGRITFAPIDGRQPIFGYVPQRESLDPIYLLSSFAVVLMGASGRVAPGLRCNSTEKEFAHQCLQRTGVADLSRRRFSELSGGQKQRVLIARALAARPDLLLLDEPTAGIDAAATAAIMELLQRLHSEKGLTILMVNHDLQAVRKTVREVIWIQHGKVSHGPVRELLSPEKIEAILELGLP